MKANDKVKHLAFNGFSLGEGIVTKVYGDGTKDVLVMFEDSQYIVPEGTLTVIEAAPEPDVVKKTPRKRNRGWSARKYYKVGHNMARYLAPAIYELRPDLAGTFTERVKGNSAVHLEEAREFLREHPAFLVMVDQFLYYRKSAKEYSPNAESKSIGMQFFIELYRWDEEIQSAVMAAMNLEVSATRKQQEAAWKAKHEAQV